VAVPAAVHRQTSPANDSPGSDREIPTYSESHQGRAYRSRREVDDHAGIALTTNGERRH